MDRESPALEGSTSKSPSGLSEALLLLLSVPLSIAIVLLRGYPTTASDTGIFLTVAAEILGGGRLYVDIIDNKDPLFYFGQGLALGVGGWRGPFLADVVWLSVAAASTHLLVRRATGSTLLGVAGLCLYPLLLTDVHFLAGMSGTPGLSLLPLFAYLALSRRAVLAGFVAAVILLLKLTLAPVLAALVAALLFRRVERRPWLARMGVGFLAVYGTAFLILGLRGEAAAYIAVVRANVEYSDAVMPIVYGQSGLTAHLTLMWDQTPTGVKALAAAGLVATALPAAISPAARQFCAKSALTGVTVAAWIGTLSMLALTAVWGHHLGALAFPICCGLVLGAACTAVACAELTNRHGQVSKLPRVVAAGMASFFVLWSVYLSPPSLALARGWVQEPYAPVAGALEEAASDLDLDGSVSYFHLGQNDEYATGAFVPSSYTLACPRFQQYLWAPDEELKATLACMDRTKPDLVAVTPLFYPDRQWFVPDWDAAADWLRFHEQAVKWLERRCTVVLPTPYTTIYACGQRR